jgi:NAD(P)-dependent dehydrogenase (short-subunit alcohol dehydrogenase family)
LLSDISEKERYTCFKLDVTSEKDTEACAHIVNDKFGRLDVLISNAGMVDYYPVSEAGSERLKKIFDVNTFGLANLTKYFLPLMIKSSGRLIVISSESYNVPSPFQPYVVSKQALEKLYDSIKIELNTKEVKTILIRPGAIKTKILKDTVDFNYPSEESVFQKEFERFGNFIPGYIGKVATPGEVARVVLKAGTSRHPRRVYHINHNPLITFLTLLPNKLKDILIKKSLK